MTQATMEQPSSSTMESKSGSTRRLGRGLNALLGQRPGAGSQPNDSSSDSTRDDEVHVELIERNPYQPRKDFDVDSLQELADSIKQHGLLQPLLVRPLDGQYQLIAGERRLLAAKKAGLETVPCRVLDLDDQNMFEVAIEENLKRKDLNVLEKAQAFQDYLEKFQCKKDELAKKLSLNRSTVTNFLRLLALSEPVKKALRKEAISAGHARALLPLNDKQQQSLCKQIQKESLSVRKTEEAVRNILDPQDTTTSKEKKTTAPQLSNHLLSVQKQLQDHFGLKVEIKQKEAEKGTVVIHFNNNDEFEKILHEVKKSA